MDEPRFHPDLKLWRFLPRGVAGPRILPVMRLLGRFTGDRPRLGAEVVRLNEQASVRVFRPASGRSPAPGIVWIHGGGLVMGKAAMDDKVCRRYADELDCIVASVEYRLAPDHPFPAALEDCHAALAWMVNQADVDADRVAVAGVSAGGGLAAALGLMARDQGPVMPAIQVLTYPMIDDRSGYRSDVDGSNHRLWNQASNRFGWSSYLGANDADGGVPPLAVPARADDLSGLRPVWIGVGSNDLFHDENVAYAHRLEEAGVACSLVVVPGGYHAFDFIEPSAPVSRAFDGARLAALDSALNGDRSR